MSKNLFLTGGTGLFGGAMIEKYLREEIDSTITVLVRSDTETEAHQRLLNQLRLSPFFDDTLEKEFRDRVKIILGDFTQQNLGIFPQSYKSLQKSITDILHSGASVDFGLPLPEARRINVIGTGNMLRFADGCSNLNAFLHISTAHVAGKLSGIITEEDLSFEQGFINTYEQTKAESELLVREWMDKLPICVFRLTTIIGDGEVGKVRQFGFFHNSIRLILQGFIPYLAGDPDGHLDLIPTEYPVEAVYYLHRNNFQPGITYHICSGREKSFLLKDFIKETINHLRKGFPHRELAYPNIVSKSEFNKLIEANNSPRLRTIFSKLSTFIEHLSLPKIFDQTNTLRDLQNSGINAPSIRTYYFNILDECIRQRFGKKADT